MILKLPVSALLLVALLAQCALLASGQAPQIEPLFRVDEDVNAVGIAPDGRIAYATKRIVSHYFWLDRGREKVDMQRDDIWLTGLDGKKKRIVDGEKLVRSRTPFSYQVQSIRWAPDGLRMTVELFTSAFVDAKGNTQESVVTLLLDQTGKEIKIQGADSIIPEGYNATWLMDGVTVAYARESTKPRLLWSIATVRPVSGLGSALFGERQFVAVAWDARHNAAVALERDAELKHPPRLVALDLPKESRRELLEVPAYLGGLSLSPSGAKVAYFRDLETLEVRDVADPQRVARFRAAYGVFQWSVDEKSILVKSGEARKTGPLTWITLPLLTANATADSVIPSTDIVRTPALRGLTFRDFAISPDGQHLAVIEPSRSLSIYPIQ